MRMLSCSPAPSAERKKFPNALVKPLLSIGASAVFVGAAGTCMSWTAEVNAQPAVRACP